MPRLMTTLRRRIGKKRRLYFSREQDRMRKFSVRQSARGNIEQIRKKCAERTKIRFFSPYGITVSVTRQLIFARTCAERAGTTKQ